MPVKENISSEEYHLDPSLSASGAKTIAMQSLAHYKYAKRKPSTAFDVGTAVHTLVLEPHLKGTVWCGPETRRGKDWKDQYAAAAAEDAVLLTEGDYQIAVDMANSVRSNAAAAELLGGDLLVEASVFSHDEATGVDMRCRPDGWRKDIAAVIDLKTTIDPSPQGFAKQVANFGYHLQDQFYRRTMLNDGHEVDRFIFIAVGKDAPYPVGVYELDFQSLDEGAMGVQYALEKFSNALKTNVWDYGFGDLQTIQIPPYAFNFTKAT